MSVKALFRVVPQKDENNRQIAERWLEALSLVDSERLSVDELLFIVHCGFFPSEWRTKIYNSINSSNENIMGKKFLDMVIWFHDLELPSANKRSAEDVPAERATKNSRQTEVPKENAIAAAEVTRLATIKLAPDKGTEEKKVRLAHPWLTE
ncbi:hypothetical protein A0J61_11449 [Choanephora cucurbitarum]|uniref:Uncharacterized protein n=1 Tax=Choanephora cucurbitarum TaxID=101091 RepID=A0A1C7MUK2_9FUNG|nr:hypothetical protein A0J61_11449 [Choanephora cucurbitarum]